MPQRDDIEQRAWRALVRAHARVSRALHHQLTEQAGLSLRAYQVLIRLSRVDEEAVRMAELANSVLLSPSATTRLVDQLVARGLVQRRQDPSDARGYLAVITDQGRALHRKATVTYREGVKEHFAGRWTDRQLGEFAEALEAFLGDGPPPPPQSAPSA
jgi:DNA-binding MarR family transcriptional regulator